MISGKKFFTVILFLATVAFLTLSMSARPVDSMTELSADESYYGVTDNGTQRFLSDLDNTDRNTNNNNMGMYSQRASQVNDSTVKIGADSSGVVGTLYQMDGNYGAGEVGAIISIIILATLIVVAAATTDAYRRN